MNTNEKNRQKLDQLVTAMEAYLIANLPEDQELISVTNEINDTMHISMKVRRIDTGWELEAKMEITQRDLDNEPAEQLANQEYQFLKRIK